MGVLSFVIKFDNGSDSVSAEFANKLAVVANMMSQPNMSKVLLRVEGHASATGAAITNQRLTERRADRVAQILVQRYGISPSRLEPLGYGYDKPGVGRDPAHPDNRRVQFLPLAAKPSP